MTRYSKKTFIEDRTSHWAVVFDLDGLLVDSEPVQQESFNVVLAPYGIRLDDEDFRPLVGRSTRENFESLKERFGLLEPVEVLLARKARAYDALVERIRPMPGAATLLRDLAARGVRLAVASSSPRQVVLRSLAAAGLDGVVSVVVGGDEVARTKPAPDVYLKAVEALGLPAGRCVAVEDSEAGVESAVRAGLRCVAVPNRYTDGDTFILAHRVLPSLEDLSVDTLHALLESDQAA